MIDWNKLRDAYERGATFRELETQFGASKSAIHRAATKSKWDKPGSKKAIDTVPAETSDTVVARHKREIKAALERVLTGLKMHREATNKEERANAFDVLKAGKIASEAMLNIQTHDRRSWGIDKGAPVPVQLDPGPNWRALFRDAPSDA